MHSLTCVYTLRGSKTKVTKGLINLEKEFLRHYHLQRLCKFEFFQNEKLKTAFYITSSLFLFGDKVSCSPSWHQEPREMA